MQEAVRIGAWSDGEKLPYLRRVAYLESHGTEWIDTGKSIPYGTELSITSMILSDHSSSAVDNEVCPWGIITDGENWTNYFCPYFYYKNQIYNDFEVYEFNFSFSSIDNIKFDVLSEVNIRKVGNDYSVSYSEDGLVIDSKKVDDTKYYLDDTLLLFTASLEFSFSKTRMYDVLIDNKISDQIHLVPVLDLSGRPAMYDEVSGQLFYNQGTGEFTWGELET